MLRRQLYVLNKNKGFCTRVWSRKQSVLLNDTDGVKRPMRYVDVGNRDDPHPLVFLSGTAQNIDTFSPHIRALSKTRRLIVPELRCQGETELLSSEANIRQHVSDFEQFMSIIGVFDPSDPVASKTLDVIGFSFGGRVASALAAYRPKMIHRLSVSCIPLHRPALGRTVMTSWLHSLRRGGVVSCYWSFLVNGYSERFLARYENKLPDFITNIEKANPHPSRLIDLIENSLLNSDDEAYHMSHCVKLITCPVQIISATGDRIAGLESVHDLARSIDTCASYVELEGGHLVPYELPVLWRKHVVEFFNRSDDEASQFISM